MLLWGALFETEWLRFEASKPLLKTTLTYVVKYSNNLAAGEKQKQDSVSVREQQDQQVWAAQVITLTEEVTGKIMNEGPQKRTSEKTL